MNAKMVLAVIVLAVVGLPCAAVVASPEKEAAADQAARRWLTLVDKGAYRTSWDATSGYFKSAMEIERWEQAMVGIRQPLGRMLSRQLKSRTYYTELPGAPDGEYVVIEFITTFENKRSSIETVTPMMDGNDGWRVSGYFIK